MKGSSRSSLCSLIAFVSISSGILLSSNNVIAANPTNIQGVKIDASGAVFTSPGSWITISGPFSRTFNDASQFTYIAQQIPAGSYTVTSTVPHGYMVSYSYCRDCVDHSAESYISGNSVTLNLDGGYADIWWKYTPSVTIQGVKIDDTGVLFSKSKITITGDPFSNTFDGPVNPYFAQQIPGGSYKVSSSVVSDPEVPAGYETSYSLCINNKDNCINHTLESYVVGNSVTLNLNQGYADIWWKYTKQIANTVKILATVNGAPWSGTLNISCYQMVPVPPPFTSIPRTCNLQQQLTTGVPYPLAPDTLPYFIGYVSGGPEGMEVGYITPSYSQVLSNGGSLTYTLNFVPKTVDQTIQWNKEGVALLKNFLNMYNPHIVVETSNPYPYKMWFFGWAVDVCNRYYTSQGCDAIFYARSVNGTNWEVYAGKDAFGNYRFDTTMNPSLWVPVIKADNKYFDQWHNGDPSVVKLGDTYYMAYSSTGFDLDGKGSWEPGDVDKDFGCIRGAVSTDGISWQKSPAPILVDPAEAGNPDGLDYERPSLMFENGKFKLWFDYAPGNMGYAELTGTPSPSLFLNTPFTTVRTGNNPALVSFPNPDVIKVGAQYYAYGDPFRGLTSSTEPGWEWKGRKITEAVSSDGVNWKVTGWVEPEADCPAIHVPEAYVENGRIYLAYGCQKGGNPYHPDYFEIRRMYKAISTDGSAQTVQSAASSTSLTSSPSSIEQTGATTSNSSSVTESFPASESMPSDATPIGNHDASNCDAITGWACDASDFNQPLTISFYADGSKDSGGTLLGSTVANMAAEAGVATQCGGMANHRFSFTTPETLKTGTAHSIYAYAAHLPGDGSLTLLGGSPESLTCSPPIVNNARFVNQSVPTTMVAGRIYAVSVTMKNTGTSTWEGNTYQLRSQNPAHNLTWGIKKVNSRITVYPSTKVTMTFSVTAPSVPGIYNFQWRMFDRIGQIEFGNSTLNVEVTVQ